MKTYSPSSQVKKIMLDKCIQTILTKIPTEPRNQEQTSNELEAEYEDSKRNDDRSLHIENIHKDFKQY
jgi:hypothetical protein